MKLFDAFATFRKAVMADYDAHQQPRRKYWKNDSPKPFIGLRVKDIPIQSMTAVRLMQFAKNANIPLGANVIATLIRIVYKMEIHPNAQITPGITLIHGTGLVVNERVRLGEKCIIAHNVTRGQSWNTRTRKMEGPTQTTLKKVMIPAFQRTTAKYGSMILG